MRNSVLFVDDELHILKAIKRGLYKEPYKKFFANSGQQALEILEKEDIHVIVTDMKMPKMNGLELLTIVKEKYPNIIKIILSGYTQLQQIIVTINRIDIYKFITKPWDMEDEFVTVIQSAIDLYNTRVENDNLREAIVKKNELYQNMLNSNSEKMALIKNDFSFIDTMNTILINYYYLLGMKYKGDIIEEKDYTDELKFIGDLKHNIIKHMPTPNEIFNAHILRNKLKNFTKKIEVERGEKIHIDITMKKELHDYKGVFRVLYYAMVNILYHYFQYEKGDVIYIVIDEKIDETEEKSELLILIKVKSNKSIQNKIRISTINTFFTNLMDAYNGLFSMEEKKGDKLVLMRFPVEIVENKPD